MRTLTQPVLRCSSMQILCSFTDNSPSLLSFASQLPDRDLWHSTQEGIQLSLWNMLMDALCRVYHHPGAWKQWSSAASDKMECRRSMPVQVFKNTPPDCQSPICSSQQRSPAWRLTVRECHISCTAAVIPRKEFKCRELKHLDFG